MDKTLIAVFLVVFSWIGTNFVLIINAASYKVFPLVLQRYTVITKAQAKFRVVF
jgi:hypothetical protein